MAWTPISNMLLAVDDPARSVDINAIYNNIPALAAGDPGAPKIQAAAFDSSVAVIVGGVAGIDYLQRFVGSQSTNTTGGPYASGYATVLASGVITFYGDVSTTNLPGNVTEQGEITVSAYRLVGGVPTLVDLATQQYGKNVNTTFSINATVLKNDQLTFKLKAPVTDSDVQTIFINNATYRTSNDTVCLA